MAQEEATFDAEYDGAAGGDGMSFRRRAFGSILSGVVLAGASNAHALEIEEASIADIEAAYRDGELTAHQVVAAYLARIDAYDKQGPYINSIINLNPKALEEADRLDATLKATGKPVGPLHGIHSRTRECSSPHSHRGRVRFHSPHKSTLSQRAVSDPADRYAPRIANTLAS